MRPSGLMPWKPAITACSPSPNFWTSLSVSIETMRAAPWLELVLSGTCQPCQLRAGTPICCSVSAMSPAVTFSPAKNVTGLLNATVCRLAMAGTLKGKLGGELTAVLATERNNIIFSYQIRT